MKPSRIKAAAERIIEFAWHDDSCIRRQGCVNQDLPCDCGYDNAVDDLRAALADLEMETE